MKCFQKYTAIIVLLVLLLNNPIFVRAVSDQGEVDVSLDVISHCGNGICEPELGEDRITCWIDCVCNYDGICELESGETYENCPSDCPPPVPPVSPVLVKPGPATIFPIIFNLLISRIMLNSADIYWETNKPALCQVFWGRTPEYKEEAISEAAFYLKHSTRITELLPATNYYFKIICQDPSGNETETVDQRFTTLTPPDITPPANISDFEATPEDSQIVLSWKNPPDPDFKAVKIVRSEDFYPLEPWDGTVVYDNAGTSFVDTGLVNGVRYYYTAFAYDKAGNYASGAITSAIPSVVPPVIPPIILPPPPIEPPPPEIEKITLEEFEFIQQGRRLIPIDGKIELKTELPLSASLAYEKVPEVLKTIMVTLERDNKLFSFLLRINKEKTAYEAIIQPPQPGVYPLTISILDYKNQTLKQIYGQMEILGEMLLEEPIFWLEKYRTYIYILLALIILGGILSLYKKKIAKPRET
ncbi:MAG: fibronectin type III domain-containing protein [Candidatus Nealsonbacteria bacterium]|nr:fibronectin type III domain-containing protein [Candidatus Nealsonbacteria bacterium]